MNWYKEYQTEWKEIIETIKQEKPVTVASLSQTTYTETKVEKVSVSYEEAVQAHSQGKFVRMMLDEKDVYDLYRIYPTNMQFACLIGNTLTTFVMMSNGSVMRFSTSFEYKQNTDDLSELFSFTQEALSNGVLLSVNGYKFSETFNRRPRTFSNGTRPVYG